jgi:hypothetical protein
MRPWLPALMAALVSGAMATGVPEPALPAWDDPGREWLETNGWLPGSLLLTDDPVPEQSAASAAPLAIAQPTAAEITGEETPPDVIPEQYWPEYFERRPAGFLVDPQGLLGAVETRDRIGFLNYHAGDSSIDLYVYLFKGDQEIPGEVREEELIERLYSQGRPAAVVYYFMGAPQRSVLYLSPSLTDTVSAAEQRRALESSVMQAFKDVEAARQLEGFLVQMSIRIYWMERMSGSVRSAPPVAAVVRPAKQVAARESRWAKLQPVMEDARRHLAPACAMLALLVAAWAARSWHGRRARWHLPEFEVEPRLGGAHAAGVGAVISFASAALPPASQRDQVPDYLRRA